MAQADGIVSNASGAAVRADLNNQLAAVFTNHSGATEPSTTYAYQWWADTVNGVMKLRNATNTAWITLFQLDGEWTTLAVENGSAASPSIYFKDSGTDTGVYSPGTDQVAITTAGAQRVNFNGTTEVVFNDGGADVDFRIEGDTEENLFKIDAGTDQVQVKNLNGGPLAGTRNRIINGDMRIDQRNNGAAQTIAAGNNVYTVDRWFALSAGANVTGQRITGATSNTFRYQLTGAASVSNISFVQRIEATNSADLVGKTITVSFDMANSLLTTVRCRVSYAGSTDTWSGVNTDFYDSNITISSAVTRYSFTVNVPAAATTGLQVLFSVGAQASGTWTIGDVQLEAGTVATPFERRGYGQELALCQRYYAKTFDQSRAPANFTNDYAGVLVNTTASTAFTGNTAVNWRYPTAMRATPTVTAFTPYSGTAFTGCFSDSSNVVIAASAAQIGTAAAMLYPTGGALSANAYAYIHATASAEL